MKKIRQIKSAIALLLACAMFFTLTPLTIAAENIAGLESDGTGSTHIHTFNNGFCTVADCSVVENAAKITETDYADFGLTEDYLGYYAIENAGQLYWFSNIVSNGDTAVNCVLVTDVVDNENVLDDDGEVYAENTGYRMWKPIGNETYPFAGVFDGNGKTVSGLYYDVLDAERCGLVAYADGAVIKNLSVVDSFFYVDTYVGAICGYAKNTTIDNCFNSASVKVYVNCAGGICGSAIDTTITNCSNEGKITSVESLKGRYPYYLQKPRFVGGICGSTSATTIEDCCNYGYVFAVQTAGGICGHGFQGTILNCYNTGLLETLEGVLGGICGSSEYVLIDRCYNKADINCPVNGVGGICGSARASDDSDITIINCYNTGAITVTGERCGGICGGIVYGVIKNSYNVGIVKGSDLVGGITGMATSVELLENCYYLESTAFDSVDNVKTGIGGDHKEVYELIPDKVGAVEVVDADRMASGEIAYLLNNSTSEGEITWGQNIDNSEQKDLYPLLNGATVYKVDDSFGVDTYSNKNEVIIIPDEHNYENGICKDCGKYQRAYFNADEVYEIDNAGKLYWFASLVNGTLEDMPQNLEAKAILTGDITINDSLFTAAGELTENVDSLKVWIPIGNDTNKFAGTFDGQNYSIKGLYFDDTASDYVGLFGYVSGGTLQNVSVKNSYINANSYVGALCGYALNSTIYNCSNSATVSGATEYIGGIIGYGSNSFIEECENIADITTTASYVGGIGGCLWDNKVKIFVKNCSNSGDISATSYVGGIGGQSITGIDNCINNGCVVSESGYAGGIGGYVSRDVINSQNHGEIKGTKCIGGVAGYANCKATNCSNSGSVSGSNQVGGVAGYQINSTLTNCYNMGSVVNTGTSTGGVTGAASNSYLYDCYNKGTVNGVNYTGGVCGSMSSSQMQRCYNLTSVNGSSYVGGVCGQNDNSTIKSVYNHVDVTGKNNYIGGVCGYNTNKAIASYSYNIGDVTGVAYVGSVCGYSSSNGIVSGCYYSEKCAIDSAEVVQNGIGNSKGNVTEDIVGKTTVMTDDRFKNGEVAFLLNGKYADKGLDWGQDIDNGKTVQLYPDFSGEPVYLSKDGVYTNSFEHIHSFENGFCTFRFCNELENLVLISETNYKDYGVGEEYIGYYAIENAGNLYQFMALVNGTLAGTAQNTSAKAVLTDDIIVNDNLLSENNTLNDIIINYRHWTPIGSSTNRFKGIFDGNGYSISGLLMEKSHYIALFGYTAGNSVVKNLDITDTYFSGYGNVAGISAYNFQGVIENCRNFAYIYGTSQYVAGICAYNNRGIIDKCANVFDLSINGNSLYVGAICGYNEGTTAKITNCRNEGDLTGSPTVVGGICGYNKYATIENCYNTGNVNMNNGSYGNSDVAGGICGRNISGTIRKVCNTGNIFNNSYNTGGICGTTNKGIVEKSYNTGEISTYLYGGGVCGVISDTLIENCYNTGTVTTIKKSSHDVGGICGKSDTGSEIKNSFNYGTVVSPTYGAGAITGNSTDTTFTNCYYLENCATDGSGTVQYGVGTLTQGTNDADKEGATISVSAERFASGEIAYKLQSSQEIDEETGEANLVWGQKSSAVGSYPVLIEDDFYEVILTDDGEYLVACKGDINGDGVIDEMDYQAEVNLALGDEITDDVEKIRADVNKDTVVDAIDVFLVERLSNKQ